MNERPRRATLTALCLLSPSEERYRALSLFLSTDMKWQTRELNLLFLDPFQYCKYKNKVMAVNYSPIHRFP